MKFSDLEGKILRVVSANPWEILLEEEVGGMNGQKFVVRPFEKDGEPFGGQMDLFVLKEERVKP